MKKVYVVWYDNCEPWEDNFQDIEAIFETFQEAVDYIEDVVHAPGDGVISVVRDTDYRNEYFWEVKYDPYQDPEYPDEEIYRLTIREIELGKSVNKQETH